MATANSKPSTAVGCWLSASKLVSIQHLAAQTLCRSVLKLITTYFYSSRASQLNRKSQRSHGTTHKASARLWDAKPTLCFFHIVFNLFLFIYFLLSTESFIGVSVSESVIDDHCRCAGSWSPFRFSIWIQKNCNFSAITSSPKAARPFASKIMTKENAWRTKNELESLVAFACR